MKLWSSTVLVCAVGVSLILTMYIVENDCTRSAQILRQSELIRVFRHASYAYFNFPPHIARWELEEAAELFESTHDGEVSEPRDLALNKFITSARLAVICKAIGDTPAYEKHVAQALERGRLFETHLKTSDALFETLKAFDQGQQQKSGFAPPQNGQ